MAFEVENPTLSAAKELGRSPELEVAFADMHELLVVKAHVLYKVVRIKKYRTVKSDGSHYERSVCCLLSVCCLSAV
jgi:hypothetical protein